MLTQQYAWKVENSWSSELISNNYLLSNEQADLYIEPNAEGRLALPPPLMIQNVPIVRQYAPPPSWATVRRAEQSSTWFDYKFDTDQMALGVGNTYILSIAVVLTKDPNAVGKFPTLPATYTLDFDVSKFLDTSTLNLLPNSVNPYIVSMRAQIFGVVKQFAKGVTFTVSFHVPWLAELQQTVENYIGTSIQLDWTEVSAQMDYRSWVHYIPVGGVSPTDLNTELKSVGSDDDWVHDP